MSMKHPTRYHTQAAKKRRRKVAAQKLEKRARRAEINAKHEAEKAQA
jgi:hypothetical protein